MRNLEGHRTYAQYSIRQSGVGASRAALKTNDSTIHTWGVFGDRDDWKSGDQRHVNQGR